MKLLVWIIVIVLLIIRFDFLKRNSSKDYSNINEFIYF